MTSKVFRLLALGVVLLTAMACSLSDDDNNSSSTTTDTTVSVSGSIDQTSTGSSKPREAATASILSLYIVYPDISSEGTEVTDGISGTGTTLTYSADVVQGRNCFVELRFESGNVFMSRFLDSDDTAADVSAPIDAISTYVAAKVKEYISNNSSATYATAIDNVLTAVFGSSYASLNLFGSFSSLIGSVTDSSVVDAINSIADAVIALDPDDTAAFEALINAIATGSQGTVEFSSPFTATQGEAAPGFVYGYDFTAPEGVLNSSNPYTVSISPAFAGNWAIDTTGSLPTVQLIADAADAGSTFSVNVTANGALGATDSFVQNITVDDLDINGEGLLLLAGANGDSWAKVVAGPHRAGDNFFVVVETDSEGAKSIQRYSVSDASDISGNGTVPYPTDGLDYEAVYPRDYSDVAIANNYVYVTDANSGIIKYDFSLASASTSTVSSFTATELAVAGDAVLAWNYQTDSFRKIDSSDSVSSFSFDSDLVTDNVINNGIGSFGDYFYVSSWDTDNNKYIYHFFDSEFTQLPGEFSSQYYNDIIPDHFSSAKAYGLGIGSTDTVLALSFTSTAVGIEADTFTGTMLDQVSAGEILANGTTLFAISNNTSAVSSYSLTSTDNVTGYDSFTNDTLVHADTLFPMVINLPEGAGAGQNSVHDQSNFFVPYYTDQNTNAWYIKGYQLTADTE